MKKSTLRDEVARLRGLLELSESRIEQMKAEYRVLQKVVVTLEQRLAKDGVA